MGRRQGFTPAPASVGDREYHQNLLGLLEPAAIEAFYPGGAFAHVVAPGDWRYVLGSFDTVFNGQATGRGDIRDPRKPFLLSGGTLTGLGSGQALVLNPRAYPYAEPAPEYYRRLALLNRTPTKFMPAPMGAADPTVTPWIFGPYGTLVTRACVQDGFTIGLGIGLTNELSQYAADQPDAALIRWDNDMSVILSKVVTSAMTMWAAGAVIGAVGGIAYVNLPSTWSSVDQLLAGSAYTFRDDFMAAVLNAGTWTKTETVGGNVTLDTRFNCLRVKGNGAGYANGVISTATYSRSALKRYVADVWCGTGSSATIFGLTDGVSVDYTRYNHGLTLLNSGVFRDEFKAGVGANISISAAQGTLQMFRLRITPGVANGALYEIQGGAANPMIGAVSWTTLSDTRGASTVDTATFKIGVTGYYPETAVGTPPGGQFISDVRVY